MQKRGFTLIELLAVIVVLAIIAVIATPMVLNTIEEAKKGAAKADAYVYAAEVERYMVLAQMDSTKPQLQSGVTYQLSSQKYEIASLADPNEVFINDLVQIKGEKPTSGYVILNSNGKIEKMEMVMSEYPIECQNDICKLKGEKVPEPACEYESGYVWEFDYATNESGEGIEQTFTVPCSGIYKLETWGAQGGSVKTYIGGYGAYSTGNINLKRRQTLYINVGGAGEDGINQGGKYVQKGGYNGGGDGNNSTCIHTDAGGGGATHIATTSGLLSTLENNISSILIVSGGGGGSHVHAWGGNYNHAGGAGGGATSVGYTPAKQVKLEEDNHVFGQGQSFEGSTCSSGGGGGFYGGVRGKSGVNDGPTSGGSGYIGSSLLTNKHMSCYGCEPSDEVSTKTISTTNASDEPISDYAKKGSGYAKITFIGEN